MTITTQFDLGDEVWFVLDCKAVCGEVQSLRFEATIAVRGGPTQTTTIYTVYASPGGVMQRHGGWLFATKADLLASL